MNNTFRILELNSFVVKQFKLWSHSNYFNYHIVTELQFATYEKIKIKLRFVVSTKLITNKDNKQIHLD